MTGEQEQKKNQCTDVEPQNVVCMKSRHLVERDRFTIFFFSHSPARSVVLIVSHSAVLSNVNHPFEKVPVYW